jgi:hypothetical protein
VTPDEIADEIELQALATTVRGWARYGRWAVGPADLDIPEEGECPTPT